MGLENPNLSDTAQGLLNYLAEVRKRQPERLKGVQPQSTLHSPSLSEQNQKQAQGIMTRSTESNYTNFEQLEEHPDLEYKILYVTYGDKRATNEYCIRLRDRKTKKLIGNFYIQFRYQIQDNINRSDTSEHYLSISYFSISSIVKEGGGRNIYQDSNGRNITSFGYFKSLFGGGNIHQEIEDSIKDFLLQEHQKMQQEKE